MFRTIAENTVAEIVEKKSKFIAQIFYVETVEEAEKIVKQVSKKCFDARHNCYAYSVMEKNGMVSRFSDDGEPSGTAGAPMLGILTSQNLSNLLVVVTRYFGGILLGTGGLVKAYTLATMEALKKAKIVQKELGQEVRVVVNYADLEKLKYFFKQNRVNIVDVQYAERVDVMAEVEKEKWEKLLKEEKNLNFCILEYEILREKFVVI